MCQIEAAAGFVVFVYILSTAAFKQLGKGTQKEHMALTAIY